MTKDLEYIWIDLHQELRKFILNKVNDAELSKDILQDVFVKIHLNIHTVQDCSKLTAWIYQITRNTIIDHFREKKFHQNITDIDLAQEDEPSFQSLSNCINSKINHLSDKYKEAIILNTLKDYSQSELANYWGISYSGAKSRVQRAKEQLKELVASCENVETDNKGNIVDYSPVIK